MHEDPARGTRVRLSATHAPHTDPQPAAPGTDPRRNRPGGPTAARDTGSTPAAPPDTADRDETL